MRGFTKTVLTLTLAAAAAACTTESATSTRTEASAPAQCADCPYASVHEAVAAVAPVGGKGDVRGVVRFTDVEGGVRVVAEISGFKPGSKHAFHVHEWGDATCVDGKCAGGHYNPEGMPHGGPDAEKHHAGDLGNLEADAHGVAHLDRVYAGISVACGRDPILGRSVIVHAGEDDFKTQPTGVPGDGAARVGCGVIGIAMPAGK